MTILLDYDILNIVEVMIFGYHFELFLGGEDMYSLENVTADEKQLGFCLTDCSPSEGCNPDDWDDD